MLKWIPNVESLVGSMFTSVANEGCDTQFVQRNVIPSDE